VDAEDFVVDDGGDSHIIEDFGAVFPDIEGAVFPDAFIIESIDLGDQPGFVVSSEQGDSVFVPYFQSQKEQECFDAVSSSVDIVSQEDVVGVGWVSSDFEEFDQVIELAVDVSADGHWGFDVDCVFLLLEDLFAHVAEGFDIALRQFLSTFQFLDH
jgi:hypothetical protein